MMKKIFAAPKTPSIRYSTPEEVQRAEQAQREAIASALDRQGGALEALAKALETKGKAAGPTFNITVPTEGTAEERLLNVFNQVAEGLGGRIGEVERKLAPSGADYFTR